MPEGELPPVVPGSCGKLLPLSRQRAREPTTNLTSTVETLQGKRKKKRKKKVQKVSDLNFIAH
jgi:hypothetical protein